MMSTNNILSPASGKPIIVPSQDIVLGLYYMTREKPLVLGEGMAFSSPEELRSAYDAGEVHLQAVVKVRLSGKIYDTTVGRVILNEIIPSEIPFELVNAVMTKKALAALIDQAFRLVGAKKTVILADQLKNMGFKYATMSGISISIDDMVIPKSRDKFIEKAQKEVVEIAGQYTEGLITDGERYNKVVDIWAHVTEQIADEMMGELGVDEVVDGEGNKRKTPSFNPIFMMADSGARGSAQQIRQLAGMRGLMAKPSGAIIETPITSNFRDGLTVLQYFISTHGARKGLADTALKTANSGYLTRRLVDVAQDVIINEDDCGTIDGIYVSSLVEGGEVIEGLGDRILGRVALEDIKDPVTDEVLVSANKEIDEDLVERIEASGIDRVLIRTVLTCKAKVGICIRCYGRDLSRGRMVHIGEAVGIVAAQSIGEPGTQLTMRTFHIGGTASRRAEQTTLEARNGGTVNYVGLNSVKSKEGTIIVMNRNAEVTIIDETGRERERYMLVYGAKLTVEEGGLVEKGGLLAEWDPYTIPILTEKSGRVRFGDIVEGVSMKEQLDEVTGLSRKIIVEYKSADMRPRLSIKGEGGKTVARYQMPVGANIEVAEDDELDAGDILAKIPRETTKTKDITGGLPRVAELFEARKPKEMAVVSEIDGVLSFGKDTKGKRKLVVTPELGEAKEYLIPKGKHISVHEGDRVRAGEQLMDGSIDPHDILKIKGDKELAKYLVDEVQEVYRLQGVKINDKHIEVIVRQMLRRVRIVDAGDTNLLPGDDIERVRFAEANEKVVAEGGAPAKAEPLLLGITKASLSTDSFISAASFQETTKVLTQAAIEGKSDYLRGLKENVIMGRLIPAGTGMARYKDFSLDTEMSEEKPVLEVAGDVAAGEAA